MNCVNSVVDNFESLPNNNKKDILLCGNSPFDENKSKIILEPTITSVKTFERFSGSPFE